jgi:hypothetical protein
VMHRQDVTEQALDWSSETPQVSAGTPFLIITTHFTQLILFFNHFLLKTVLELSPRPCEALGREYSWYQYVEARKLGHSGPFEGLTGQLGFPPPARARAKLCCTGRSKVQRCSVRRRNVWLKRAAPKSNNYSIILAKIKSYRLHRFLRAGVPV